MVQIKLSIPASRNSSRLQEDYIQLRWRCVETRDTDFVNADFAPHEHLSLL
jgi:hypothetical protein